MRWIEKDGQISLEVKFLQVGKEPLNQLLQVSFINAVRFICVWQMQLRMLKSLSSQRAVYILYSFLTNVRWEDALWFQNNRSFTPLTGVVNSKLFLFPVCILELIKMLHQETLTWIVFITAFLKCGLFLFFPLQVAAASRNQGRSK